MTEAEVMALRQEAYELTLLPLQNAQKAYGRSERSVHLESLVNKITCTLADCYEVLGYMTERLRQCESHTTANEEKQSS